MIRKGYNKEELEYRKSLWNKGIAICSTCHRELPFDSFTSDKGSTRGLSYECRDCQKKTRESRKDYRKEWEEKNKERLKEYRTKYHEDNKEKRHLRYRERIKTDDYKKWQKEYNRRLTTKYRKYKSHALKRNLIFDLTFEKFKEIASEKCCYCGDLPSDEFGNYYSGIDRIDSSLGYTVENVVPCCSVCNRMKNKRETNNWYNKMSQILSHLESIGYISPSLNNPEELQFNDNTFNELSSKIQKG